MEAHAKEDLTKTYYGEHFTHGFHTQNYQKSQAPLDTHPENTRGIHRITQPNPYPWIFSDTNPTKPIHKKSVWVKILPLGTQISGTQSSPYYSPLDPIFKILYNILYSSITVALKLTAGCLVCTCKIKSCDQTGTHPKNTHGIHKITQPNPYPWIFSDTNPTKPIHKKLVWVQILPLGTQISGTQSPPYYLQLNPIFKILYNIRYSSITVALKLTAGWLVCTCKIKSCDQGLKQQLCSNRAVLSGFVRPGVATVPLVCTYKIKSCDQNLKHRLYSGHTINGFVGPGLATVPLIQVTERKILLFVYLIDYLSTIILESYKSRNFLTNSMQKP